MPRSIKHSDERIESRRRPPGIRAGLLALACALVAVAPAAAQTGKPEKANITFGVFPITNYGVVYLSLQQGFFQQEGLNVTPRVMGSNPIAGIVGGDFDTGGVTWTAFLLATNRPSSLVPPNSGCPARRAISFSAMVSFTISFRASCGCWQAGASRSRPVFPSES
jgi:hypothetical protein